MQNNELIVGLDIGSTKIAACAGRVKEGGIEVTAVAETPVSGVRKGMISDIEDTVSAVSILIEELERKTATQVNLAIAGIGGVEVTTMESKGVVAVARPDSEITHDDTNRALEAARSITLPPNREVLHALPKYFTTDHDEKIQNPVGLASIRLEVTSELILVSSLAVKNLERVIVESGLTLGDIVFSPIAAATAALSKRQMESGVILMDIGAATTDLAIFEEGQLVHATVIPIGSQHITNDIAIGIRTNLEIAEQLKKLYGAALPELVKASESIRLSEFDETEHETIKRQFLSQIIKARLDELFSLVNNELKQLDRNGKLPAGVILIGNGTRLEGLIDYTKEMLKLPASIAHPRLELPIKQVDHVESADYTTSCGLMLWGLEHGVQETAKPILPKIGKINVSGVIDKAKDMFRQFLP